jgi:hypothetical protein
VCAHELSPSVATCWLSPRTGYYHGLVIATFAQDFIKLPARSTDITTCTGVSNPGGFNQGEILDQGQGGRLTRLIAVEMAFEKTPAIPRYRRTKNLTQ